MFHLLNNQIINAALDFDLGETIDNFVQQHLEICKECKAKFDWLKIRFSEAGASILRDASEPKDKSRCLTERQMEALVDKTLSEEESERLINHTTECPYCLDNLRSLFTARKKGYLKEASPFEAKESLDAIRKIFKPERIPVTLRILKKGLELIPGRGVISKGSMPSPEMLRCKIDIPHADMELSSEEIFHERIEPDNESIRIEREMMSLHDEKENLTRKIKEIEYRQRELLERKWHINEAEKERKRIPMKEAFKGKGVILSEKVPDWKIRRSYKDRKEAPNKGVISDKIELKDDERNPLYSIIFEYESSEQASLTAVCLNDKIDVSDLEIRLNWLGDVQIPVKAPKQILAKAFELIPPHGESKGKRTAVFSGIKSGKYLLRLTHPDLPAREFEIEIR